VARTVVAQPPIAAKWFGRVFRSCVWLCGGSCGVCVVRVTCVLLKYGVLCVCECFAVLLLPVSSLFLSRVCCVRVTC